MQELKEKEAQLNRYIEQGDTAAAVGVIRDLCEGYAARQEFEKAEAFRDKLFEVDPLALKEIIAAAEIIEQKKSGATDKNHMELWAPLYRQMTTEEANALYYCMKTDSRPSGEMIFFQGDKNDRLYFIDQGQLSLFYRQGDQEIFLKKIAAGQIAGEDTFFPVSVCTTSLMTLTPVNMRVLERTSYRTLVDKWPALESKLTDYSLRQQKIEDLVKEQGLDRRIHRRHKIAGRISNQILGKTGEPLGKPFKGDLADLSVGGGSFFITANNNESVRRMLGRDLRMRFSLHGHRFELTGQVISVIDHHFGDFSVHVNFKESLTGEARAIVERI